MSTDRPVVDFNHHSPAYGADPFGTYAELRGSCPVAYTESDGGYWVLSAYDDIHRAANDDLTFSSRHDLPNDGRSYTGITIPSPPIRSTPIELDPPSFLPFRQMLNPWFSPKAMERLRPVAERCTADAIDRCIESGRIDLVLDLANPIPAQLTMEILGMPMERWEPFAYAYHASIYTPPGTPENDKAMEAMFECLGLMEAEVAERRARPRDDFLTHLTTVEVEGEALTDEVIIECCNLILAGGLDTTTALLANAFVYLDEHRDERQRLIDDPGLIPKACEEFLRYYSPVQLLARTANEDVEIGGQHIPAGERIALCWAAANHDPAVFDRPDEIILDRLPNRHAAFGVGAHRCLGSNLARTDFAIVLGQVLDRMPDYELVDGVEKYPTIGIVNGYVQMPARFTPGPRRG